MAKSGPHFDNIDRTIFIGYLILFVGLPIAMLVHEKYVRIHIPVRHEFIIVNNKGVVIKRGIVGEIGCVMGPGLLPDGRLVDKSALAWQRICA